MGLSPYEKQQYKESKRRRKQALLQSETGYIKPYKRGKKHVVLICCAFAALCLAAAAVWFAFKYPSIESKASETEEAVTIDDTQLLRVVDRADPLKASQVPPLTTAGGVEVHQAIAEPLESLLSMAREQGIELRVSEGYVSYDEQSRRYEANLAKYIGDPKYTAVRAQAAAQRAVPEAGCSEAQTGLLLSFDVSDPRAKAFLERECINYGFILRFPSGKEEQTHIDASESLYRYVGEEHAKKMRSFDMCLEEYADYRALTAVQQ